MKFKRFISVFLLCTCLTGLFLTPAAGALEVPDIDALRKSSPTFGKHVCVLLSEENKRQFFIPRGFAHGFVVLSEEAVFMYKVDNKYAPQAEASIVYNDETLGIDWMLGESQMLLSPKDKEGMAFRDAVYFE